MSGNSPKIHEQSQHKAAPRMPGVDLFRVLSILAVIIIHTSPFSRTPQTGNEFDLAAIVNQLARFAVPFFFTVSGYFWAGKVINSAGPVAPTITMIRKLMFLFIAWSIFYLLFAPYAVLFEDGLSSWSKQVFWSLIGYLQHPLKLVLQGTESHLWFLPALISCAIISCLFIYFKQKLCLIIVSISLYTIGLAGKAYSHTPIGFATDFNFRDGPFFGLIFFVSGYFLYQKPVGWRLRTCLWVTFIGLLLSVIEMNILHRYPPTLIRQDFIASTYIYGVCVTLVALSIKGNIYSIIKTTAPLVLGIYALHYSFVSIAQSMWPTLGNTMQGSIALVFAVLVASIISAKFIAKSPVTRKMVS